ncbi:MAG: ferredoxin [Pleurocapsa sp.]
MSSKVHLPSINDLQQSSKRRIIVCRGRSCRKYDANRVFENFQQNLSPDVELISVPCLGQCGNGSMVLVEPELIWYSQVHPDEVAMVIEQHVMGNKPVKAMLYSKFHSKT